MAVNNLEAQLKEEFFKKYGLDLLNIDKCKEIKAKILKENDELTEKLDLKNKKSIYYNVLHNSNDLIKNTNTFIEQFNQVKKEVEMNLLETNNVRIEVQNRFDELNKLHTCHQYLKILQRVETIHKELENEFKKKDDEQCATLFANLSEISKVLCDFKGVHLGNYLKNMQLYWYEILKNEFTKDFDEILKKIKWPFISTNFNLHTPLIVNIENLQLIAEYLLQIQCLNEFSETVTLTGILSDFSPICLPIELLIKPLKNRFIYHFYGARKTNRIDKPEWYFTQILTWIRDHEDYCIKWIQPIINKLGILHINAKLEFSKGLVQLVVKKLNTDIRTLQFDDFNFSHSIDEALAFNKELIDTYKYPKNQPSILVVLTQASVFIKWIAMENKYASEKMDKMLENSEAFEILTTDIDELKITTTADCFITLLQTITERYECLPQPGHRLQFLDLQLKLLDEFRIRLLQIINYIEFNNIIESKIPMIVNTIYYIENVLIDWGNMLHFLNLYYYKNQFESSINNNTNDNDNDDDLNSDSVFTDTLNLYNNMRQDLLIKLSQYVLYEIKLKSRNYRREQWSLMKLDGKDYRCLSLTPSACCLFEILAKYLHQLEKNLTNKLFTITWRSIANDLDNFLMEFIIFDNRFNDNGALQLKYDIMRNLLPLFSQYCDKPDIYFPQITESCIILNLSKGSALLLKQTLLALKDATGVEDTRTRTLNEMGIFYFTPQMVVKILNQRTDITFKKLDVD